MRHGKGESRLEEVDGKAEQSFEEKGADHEEAEGDEEALWGVDAERGDEVEGGFEGGICLDVFGLNDEADDGDDDGESQDFDDAVREDAQ